MYEDETGSRPLVIVQTGMTWTNGTFEWIKGKLLEIMQDDNFDPENLYLRQKDGQIEFCIDRAFWRGYHPRLALRQKLVSIVEEGVRVLFVRRQIEQPRTSGPVVRGSGVEQE